MTSTQRRPITSLDDFHEEVMAEARRNGYPGPSLRSRITASAALLLLLVGSLYVGDTTVGQALSTISSSIPLV